MKVFKKIDASRWLTSVLLIAAFFWAPLVEAKIELESGEGVFVYSNDEIHSDLEIRVFYHAPEQMDADTPIWFVIHGAGRNASGYFNNWKPHVENEDVLFLVPEFTREDFPGSRAYNLANIQRSDGSARPQEEWTYSIVERLFDRVREDLELDAETYVVYGHSAGSQFVHRMLFLLDETRIAGAVLANAGWYTMPRYDIEFPYGFGGMDVSPEKVKEVFQLPVVVLLGDQDTDENHRQLRRTEPAMAQGPHRFARGETYFETAKAHAERLEVPFAWKLETVPGVAHSNRGMAPPAARHLREMSEKATRN